ncbi:MAG TPA: hypothetical protein PK990_01965 [Salinivirgaceae bacterium]|nr:hypothetical protein [Salinivirgaceae bacterium]
MPYRRLPNTDMARIRAITEAIKQSNHFAPLQLAISPALLLKLRAFLPLFKQTVDHQRETFRRQIQNSKAYLGSQRKAKLYISHFIQVMNMAIIRGELKPEIRKFYGLDENTKTVPLLNSENDIIEWGEKIIKGEANRLATGASPITNPTIALVKVKYEDYLRTYQNHKTLQDIAARANQKVAEMRVEADALILELWNQIEKHFSNLPPEEMREKASSYGVVYVYRKEEKEKLKAKSNDNQLFN